jgi:GNAT superfamily N-acetyltransferase
MANRPILVTTYFLELFSAPKTARPSQPTRTSVKRAKNSDLELYRCLYQEVGETWLWYERWNFDDEELRAALDGAEVHVLWVDNTPAGYVEFKKQSERDMQIIYFGLRAEFVGRGLGRFFLDWSVRYAFSHEIDRLWVHTCSLDHENALPTYHGVGFREFRRESCEIPIPAAARERQEKRRASLPLRSASSPPAKDKSDD